MGDIHIKDDDQRFEIDVLSRKINKTSEDKTIIQYDHNSECFTFSMPRFVEGHDMSSCTKIEVHYINTDAEDKTKVSAGAYRVEDISVDEDDKDKIVFTWILSGNATKYAGTLAFNIRFSCIDENDIVTYAWHTRISDNVEISKGMCFTEEVLDGKPDILEQMLKDVRSTYVISGYWDSFLPEDDPMRLSVTITSGSYDDAVKRYNEGHDVLFKLSTEDGDFNAIELLLPLASFDADGTFTFSTVSNEFVSEFALYTVKLFFGGGCSVIKSNLSEGIKGVLGDVFGENTIRGCNGFYIDSINTEAKWIVLSRERTKPGFPEIGGNEVRDNSDSKYIGYDVGDVFSIVNGAHHDFCGTIVKKEGNKIYYQEDLPFNVVDKTTNDDDDHVFFVPSKPDIGPVKIVAISFATGIGTKAAGKASFGAGRLNVAGGDYSFVACRENMASYCSTALGLRSKALGRYALAIGSYVLAAGEYAIALGCSTRALGESSVALNAATIAKGIASLAIGRNTEAIGAYSFVGGLGTKAEGIAAFAINQETNANGENSVATGYGTYANGLCSIADGLGTIADGDFMHVGGKCNKTTGNKIVVYGNGTDGDNRSDAYSLDWQGNGEYAGHVNSKFVKQDCFDNGKTDTELGIRNFDDLVEPGFYNLVWYHKNDGGTEEITPWNIMVSVKKQDGKVIDIYQVREAFGPNTGKEYCKQKRTGAVDDAGVITWSEWVNI